MGIEAHRCSNLLNYSSGPKAPKGVSSVSDPSIRNNLSGTSRFMGKSGWVDPQGRKGKGYGVYRFSSKYGSNIDGYSPIYSPDDWTATGDTYSLGVRVCYLGLVYSFYFLHWHLILLYRLVNYYPFLINI